MRMLQIDTDGGGCAAEARALLAQLNDRPDDQKVVSLGVLTGADLCLLGGTGHPVCWEALSSAWQQLGPTEREQLAEARTLSMLHHDLIKNPPVGRGVAALFSSARYPMSTKLSILLGTRRALAFIIATHHESRSPAVTYFQVQGTNAIVEEIPDRAGSTQSPLDVMFTYRLLSHASAACELARWALKPVQAGRYQPKPPRLISFFGRVEDDSQDSCQLAIQSDGRTAHVDGPDISADLGKRALARFMADLVTTWAVTHNPVVDGVRGSVT
jgi:hypothetical protein